MIEKDCGYSELLYSTFGPEILIPYQSDVSKKMSAKSADMILLEFTVQPDLVWFGLKLTHLLS